MKRPYHHAGCHLNTPRPTSSPEPLLLLVEAGGGLDTAELNYWAAGVSQVLVHMRYLQYTCRLIHHHP